MTYQLDQRIATTPSLRLIASCWLSLAVATTGCSAIDQIQYDVEYTAITLGPQDLKDGSIGFLTPAAATGREADKQALAMTFAETLQEVRPEITVVPLPNILSAVNAADLDQEYKQMYRDYLETGILEGSILRRIGEVGDVRYVAQLSLASFRQWSTSRFSLLGLRILDTEQANMRVFIQIWDVENAAVAWEGSAELNYAYETGAEMPVMFNDVAQLAAERLFAQLPGAEEK